MKVLFRLLALMAIVAIFVPSSASAILDNTQSGNVRQQVEASACQQIVGVAERVRSTAEQRQQSITAQREQSKNARVKAQQTASDKIKEHRQSWDTRFSQGIEKLKSVASTEDQQSAVKSYDEAIRQSVEARRVAQDNARLAHRTSADTLITKQREANDSALNNMNVRINQAIDRATADCRNGTPVGEVLSSLKSGIKDAGSSYAQARKGFAFDSQLSATNQARSQAEDIANKAFNDKISQARQELVKAFGQQANLLEN